ncbi:SIS domain-containing protein [Streptomyces sp. B1866]|uniref:SIS domain-containing protein n=1 Tax=Streptomyces sp. B1866 TaxID=3075431 RepID=UPI002891D8ED|nr:SIS domain-containing protein [Streptomyces sp. B1866]MDT3399778.1 SIS domain-containing protein [Streptomyces sp. B1866]
MSSDPAYRGAASAASPPPPGAQTPGGQTPGGQTPGGQTPGGQTPGGQTPGGQTPGGQAAAGQAAGGGPTAGSCATAAEIASQPGRWRRAAALAPSADALPRSGERVAVVGCGTSWFVAQSYAALREARGQGHTDAFAASEFPRTRLARFYDRVLAISRSGTTTEVLALLDRLRGAARLSAVTAVPGAPVADAADETVVLDFADEESVVQTRFATSALALLRARLGEDVEAVAADGERALARELPPGLTGAEQVTFVGTGWTVGLAREAALKLREAAGAWTEAYPAMEYRHGPVSVTGPGRAVWALGALPAGLAEDVAAAGGALVADSGPHAAPDRRLDPMADLVRVHRLAVAVAQARGLDPDRPRNLTRSVVLPRAHVGGPEA